MNYREKAVCTRLIDKRAKDIIQCVHDFVDDPKIKDSICRDRSGKRQFNDIMQAAAETTCVEELLLYISYKKVKEGTYSMWKGLAEPLNREFLKLKNSAAAIVEEASGEQAGEGTTLQNEDVHLELIRRYAGYLMWKANIVLTESAREVRHV